MTIKKEEIHQSANATRQAQGRKMRSKRNEVNLRITNDGIAERCEKIKAQNPNISAPDLWHEIFSIGLNKYENTVTFEVNND